METEHNLEMTTRQRNAAEETVKRYLKEVERSNKQICEAKEKIRNMQATYNTLEKTAGQYQHQIARLTLQYRELLMQYTDLQQHAKDLDEEKESLLLRLSEIADGIPVSENHDIAYLSGIYRPTKLCEMFFEIYDNEWTEAFEELEECDERQIIDVLFSLLKATSEICDELTNNQLKSLLTVSFLSKSPAIKQRLEQTEDTDNMSPMAKSSLDTSRKDSYSAEHDTDPGADKGSQVCIRIVKEGDSELLVDIKEFRTKLSDKVLTVIQEELPKYIAELFNISLTDHAAVEAYMKSCVRICWLAGLQDPPMYIRFDEVISGEQKFDKTIYREYTKSGPKMDYVVWPPIYLHNDGPLMSKGIAQGMK